MKASRGVISRLNKKKADVGGNAILKHASGVVEIILHIKKIDIYS